MDDIFRQLRRRTARMEQQYKEELLLANRGADSLRTQVRRIEEPLFLNTRAQCSRFGCCCACKAEKCLSHNQRGKLSLTTV